MRYLCERACEQFRVRSAFSRPQDQFLLVLRHRAAVEDLDQFPPDERVVVQVKSVQGSADLFQFRCESLEAAAQVPEGVLVVSARLICVKRDLRESGVVPDIL